jgi:hypothetical protein
MSETETERPPDPKQTEKDYFARPGYKALINLAGTQKGGVCMWLTNGQVLRGSVYDTDERADWIRLFTWDGPHHGRGPMWVNQDHVVAMWWAPDDSVLPFDVQKQMHDEDEED